MAAITVLVGKEEKEISGLTRKTTSEDVIEALLTDLHNERNTAANGTDFCSEDIDLGDISESDIHKLVKDYVIFETWRGCEKPLLPQTRILTVWKAWGKEQNHVKFTLKKYKSFAICHRTLELPDESQCESQSASENKQLKATHYVHKLSHGQKKRIRRSLMQYQRAVKQQAHQGTADGNNNGGKQASRRAERNAGDRPFTSRQKATDSPMITLTEEQFVDAVVPDPENILLSDGTFGRNTLNKEFNRERCTYRRPHHRRLSLMMDDSDCATDQNGLLSFSHKLHHYPYCSKNKRRSNPKRTQQHDRKHAHSLKRLKNHKVHESKYSTDSTSSESLTLSSDDEFKSHSEGEDADDEKSIMAGFVGSIPRQKISNYPNIVLPDVERLISGAVSGSAATNTDSSSGVTTCSETSNTSGFSFTTTSSSDASVSADLEAYFAKRNTAATATAKAKSSEKPKSGAAKLFKISNPAQSIIGSFKKKKKTAQPPQANSSLSSKPVQTNCTASDKSTSKLSAAASETNSCLTAGKKQLDTEAPQKAVSYADNRRLSQKKNSSPKEQVTDDDAKAVEEVKQLVLTQQRTLGSDSYKITYTSSEIEKLEAQVQQSQKKTNKTTASLENKSVHHIIKTETMSNSIYSSRTPHWIQECTNVADLEEYLSGCERVVSKQLQIEENRRTAEILFQKVQEEIWKVSESASSASEKDPLRITSSEAANDASDDSKESSLDTLSVSSGKTLKTFSSMEDSNQDDPLEVERTRTELEASLYLGLRLSTEIEEIEKLTNTSRQLVQSKGESLLSLVRELAQSKDGISPDLWEEYGDLLAAYDEEVSLQRYLAVCAENDLAKHAMPSHDGMTFSQHLSDVDPTSPTTDALHHALSPWLWCEHCKQELEKAQMNRDVAPTDSLSASPHWLSHSAVPDSFSDLPLPSPSSFVPDSKLHSVDQQRIPSLLPMPPVPACNDSDYEEIAEKRNGHDSAVSATSTIITTEDVIPRGIVLRLHPSQNLDRRSSPVTRPGTTLDLLSSRKCSSNPEDSGNASAGSTASFTSTNSDITDVGSRNSSCDGGSPRPLSVCAESQDSAHSSPFFSRGALKRSSEKHKFVFPQFKRSSKAETTKNSNGLLKPPLPPKSGSRVLAQPPAAKKPGTELPGKLVRSNSGRTKKTTRGPQDLMSRRATSFGKGQLKAPNGFTNPITGILKRPIIHNSHCDIAQIKNKKNMENIQNDHANDNKNGGPISRYNLSVYSGVKDRSSPFLNNKDIISYDNDSDTGLSSLHSTDSYDKLTASTGETLV